MKLIFYILFGILSFKGLAQTLHSARAIDHNLTSQGPLTISQKILDKELINRAVDSIITFGIKEQAFPGAQLLVAINGDIIFHKAYGYHTYDSIHHVGLKDLYDLASVTKIIGPLPVLMKLYEEGVLDLDEPFSTYWKPWKRIADKKDLTLREILAHQAGLKPYIVFLEDVLKEKRLRTKYVRNKSNIRYQKQAYENLFVKNGFTGKIYRKISRSEVSDEKVYRYSGLAFLIFPELISQLTGSSYEYYLQKNFYLPMGATGLVHKPKTKGVANPIVPTEKDSLYRKGVVQGWVHDENASLLGGISGNAGLFGTAKDVFKMMQLYQNYGTYKGKRYLSEATVREFTTVQYPENQNRRALGFDKPLIQNDQYGINEAYPAPEVSPASFGHSGFTGTFVWADPKNQLVYVFLSNRVYPSRTHRKLYELNIRVAVQQLFYKALSASESVN